jgi:hypothetical protein
MASSLRTIAGVDWSHQLNAASDRWPEGSKVDGAQQFESCDAARVFLGQF